MKIQKKNQAFAKGRKLSNTIWELNDDPGVLVSSFDGLVGLGVRHFGDLFTAPIGLSLVEIVRVAHFFPCFVDDNDNMRLMEVITDNELLKILHSFQKDKSLRPDGWPVEFYIGFFDLVRVDLLKVVEESRLVGHVHGPINTNFISLIP